MPRKAKTYSEEGVPAETEEAPPEPQIPMHTGKLLLKSVDGDTGLAVEVPADLETQERGEGYLFNIMRGHHPLAMRDKFEIEKVEEEAED